MFITQTQCDQRTLRKNTVPLYTMHITFLLLDVVCINYFWVHNLQKSRHILTDPLFMKKSGYPTCTSIDFCVIQSSKSSPSCNYAQYLGWRAVSTCKAFIDQEYKQSGGKFIKQHTGKDFICYLFARTQNKYKHNLLVSDNRWLVQNLEKASTCH